jgi:hypothetical protein
MGWVCLPWVWLLGEGICGLGSSSIESCRCSIVVVDVDMLKRYDNLLPLHLSFYKVRRNDIS